MEKEVSKDKAEQLNEETEDKIIEAFTNSEKSWDKFVAEFSGEVSLSKDHYTEWLEKLTIEDIPKTFIAEYIEKAKELEDFEDIIQDFVTENYTATGGTMSGQAYEGLEIELNVKDSEFKQNLKELKKQIENL